MHEPGAHSTWHCLAHVGTLLCHPNASHLGGICPWQLVCWRHFQAPAYRHFRGNLRGAHVWASEQAHGQEGGQIEMEEHSRAQQRRDAPGSRQAIGRQAGRLRAGPQAGRQAEKEVEVLDASSLPRVHIKPPATPSAHQPRALSTSTPACPPKVESARRSGLAGTRDFTTGLGRAALCKSSTPPALRGLAACHHACHRLPSRRLLFLAAQHSMTANTHDSHMLTRVQVQHSTAPVEAERSTGRCSTA